ncbi:MAG: integrase arm-type DNA-binding domain-containing protein [Proteobacteria bacterium]|nr:integrase arm-type DNA-binding domain-containing protein [Pseudomonadota bacterium]
MRRKLTKRTVGAIAPGARDVLVFDTEIKGFGVKVTPKGRRVYLLQYSRGNRSRRATIGRHGDITADQARIKAERLRGAVADGRDPAAERAAERAVPTMAEFAGRYLTEYARPQKKPRSIAEDERNLEAHVKPALGARRLNEIEAADVARLHAALGDRPVLANRVLALLSTMFSLAEQWGLRREGSNPCRRVHKYREAKRERFLSDAELARLGEVLKAAEARGEHRSVVAASGS